jgi:hypothetical protein
MRYAYARINQPSPQLDWNALADSFAVHSHNFFDFLTGDTNSRNFKASDFISRFKIPKGAKRNAIKSKLDKINHQIMHLSKDRTKESSEKMDLEIAKIVYDWLEK